MNEVMTQNEGFAGRCQKVLNVARQLFQEKPDWVTFFRETLGVKGAARAVFPSQVDYVQFEQSKEFLDIQKMVASLRTRKAAGSKNEPTRVITVRLPESLHEALKAEASDHNTSMNKLCISKLLQVLIEDEKANQAMSSRNAGPAAPKPMQPVSAPASAPASAQPSSAAQAAQTASFRSTYNQPTSQPQSPGAQTQPPRFGN